MSLSRDLRVLGSQAIGPGIGNLFYLVTNKTTDVYYNLLLKRRVPEDQIFTTLASAEDAMTSGRNDTLFVYPGTHTVTASLTWDKNNTHLVGCGGPLSRGGMGSGVYINCETAAVAQVIDVQGSNVEFHNVQLRNVAANAGNLCGLKVSSGVNFYASRCQFSGQGAATQVATAGTCALWLYTASTGKPWGATFENCKIGDAGELVRTVGAVIYFSGTAGGTAKYVDFVDCVIEGWSQTAANPAVHFAANYCIDRWVRFKNCEFFNYYVNNVANLTQVFDNDCGTTFKVMLHNTCQTGYTAWNSDGLQYIFTDSPAAGATGGLMTATT